jgi:cAMP phosphodiesterase
VDAGSHLASIVRILEKEFPLHSPDPHPEEAIRATSPCGDAVSASNSASSPDDSERSPTPPPPITTLRSGPFAGLAFPHASARANAVHVVREHVSTYLITHPHLDHLSGFAINTAAFHNTSRPKRLAALPFTVLAIKTHIFNDIIWPNLTDEDNGVGLVTFQRLTEGGNLALGEGTSRGFIEVCEGLAVKAFRVSHGKCASTPRPDHAQQAARRSSNPAITHSQGGNHQAIHAHSHSVGQQTPADGGRRSSIFSQSASQPGTPTFHGQECTQPVVDSTAFFIRADASGKEVLVFGDVEPDSLSVCPRNHLVWAEAAYKISHGLLNGIFIECSFNDSQRDEYLFGHLAPRHLIAELQTLAEMVTEKKKEMAEKVGRKRKRTHAHANSVNLHPNHDESARRSRSRTHHTDELMKDLHPDEEFPATPSPIFIPTAMDQAPRHSTDTLPDIITIDHHRTTASAPSSVSTMGPSHAFETPDSQIPDSQVSHDTAGPLKGVRVIIIHIKDSMADGPPIGESILKELRLHEARLRAQGKALGCEFVVSRQGDNYWF